MKSRRWQRVEHKPAQVLGWHSLMPERVNPEKQLAAAGTPVTCPKCKDEIGRISIPIYSGMRIRADAVDFHRHQRREANQTAHCSMCGEPYMKHRFLKRPPFFATFIHTPLGWI